MRINPSEKRRSIATPRLPPTRSGGPDQDGERHTKRSAWPSVKSILKGVVGALVLFEPSVRGSYAPASRASYPTYGDLPFGLEFEFLGMEADHAAAVVHGSLGAQAEPRSCIHFHYDTWQVRQDAVLDDDGNYVACSELVSPVLRNDDVPTISSLAHSLEEHGARVSAGCGVHVHLNGADFDTPALLRLTAIVHRFENQIFRHFNVSDYRRENYSQALDAKFLNRLHQTFPVNDAGLRWAWYESNSQASPQQLQNEHLETRNHGLNLHALFVRGTLELRYFEGTTDGPTLASIVDFSRRLGLWAIQSDAEVTAADFSPTLAGSGGPIENLFDLLRFAA